MFSQRIPASLAANRLTVALAERRSLGLPLIDLTVTNPTHCGLELYNDGILGALADRRSLTYEPQPCGRHEVREAIAVHHARQGAVLHPDRLLLTASTSEAYSWAFKLLCSPGDEVLAPRPSYPLFNALGALESIEVHTYPLLPELDWAIDRAALEAQLTPRTRALLVVNPNHPAGAYVHLEDWVYLTELAARRGLAIISDEVFFDYRLQETGTPFSALSLESGALVLTLSGLSKIAALPQMKLGWIHVGGPPELAKEACARLEWIADTFLPVSAPVQFAAPAWLRLAPGIQETVLARCRAGLAVWDELRGPVAARPVGGGWTVLLEGPATISGEKFVLSLLARKGILAQPGYFYDLDQEGFLAISLLVEVEIVRRAAPLLAEFWNQTSDFPSNYRWST